MSILKPIILASQSPRRKYLLNQIGIEHFVIPSSVDEDLTYPLPPTTFTEYWARKKAKNVAKNHPYEIIVGADTIVTLDGTILGKPKNRSESFSMLKLLSGRTHEVITGVAFYSINLEIDETFNERTLVSFKSFSDHSIFYYIDRYKPFDKAGSYGIQDWFAVNISKINGCYFNVMGLPLSSFYSNYKRLTNSNKE